MPRPGYRYWLTDRLVEGEDLQIHGLGLREAMAPGMVDRPQGTGDVLIMRWHQPVRIATRAGRRRHPAGSVVVWGPADGHHYGSRDRRWSHSWLHCSGPRIDELLARGILPTNRALEVGADGECWEHSVLAIGRELRGPYAASARVLGNLLENALIALARVAGLHPTAPAQPIPLALRAVRHRLDTRFHEQVRLADLAREAGYSVPRLCALFKRHYGCGAIDHLIRVRMQHAAYLLRDRELGVAQVAHQVGYDDPAWFSRQFKQHHGASPRAWRQREATA